MNTYTKDKWLEAIDVHVALKTNVTYRNAAGKTQEKTFTATFGYLAYFIAKEYADWTTGEGVFIAKSTFAATVGMSRTSVIVPFFQIMEALDLLVKDDSKKKYDSDYYDLRMPCLFPDETDIKTRVQAAKETAAAKKKDYRARLSSPETVSVLSEDSVCPPVGQCLSSTETLTTNRTSNVPSNITTNTVDADASPLNSKSNITQGEDSKKEEVVVVDSPLASNYAELPFVDNKSSALNDDVWAFLDKEEKSSAPAAKNDAPSDAGVSERDITIEEFIAQLETMTEEEQNVAAYGFEYKSSHALQQILLVAKESTKPEYDMWKTESHKYSYAADNVGYEGPGRNKKEQPVSAGHATGYNLDEEW